MSKTESQTRKVIIDLKPQTAVWVFCSEGNRRNSKISKTVSGL